MKYNVNYTDTWQGILPYMLIDVADSHGINSRCEGYHTYVGQESDGRLAFCILPSALIGLVGLKNLICICLIFLAPNI